MGSRFDPNFKRFNIGKLSLYRLAPHIVNTGSKIGRSKTSLKAAGLSKTSKNITLQISN